MRSYELHDWSHATAPSLPYSGSATGLSATDVQQSLVGLELGYCLDGKLPARQFTIHTAVSVIASDARRAAPHGSPLCASSYSRHTSRSARPSDLCSCLIDRQHDTRCLRTFDRYWQGAKNRTGRGHHAGKRGFLVKCHHGCAPFWDARLMGRNNFRMPNVSVGSFLRC